MQLPGMNPTKSLRSRARLRSQLPVPAERAAERAGCHQGRQVSSSRTSPRPWLPSPRGPTRVGSPRGAPRYPAPTWGWGQSRAPTTCRRWGGTDGAHGLPEPLGRGEQRLWRSSRHCNPPLECGRCLGRAAGAGCTAELARRGSPEAQPSPNRCWLPARLRTAASDARLCSAITQLSCKPSARSPRLSPTSCSAFLHLPSRSARLDTTLFFREPQLRPGTAAAFEDASSARPHRAPTKGEPHDLSSSSQ